MDGLLILDKPSGVTSCDMVRRTKRWFNQRKVGHAGTLDPLASGLLVVCLGQSTRYAQYFLEADKAYQVTLKLGQVTDTYDSEGSITATADVPPLTEQTFFEYCRSFTGTIEQVPPMYSALKKDGVPLYKLAREGKTIERAPRVVTIHSLDIEAINFPFVTLNVHCTKGTYIRSLVHDIGQAIGCGAHIVMLRRTLSAPFTAEMMQSVEAIDEASEAERGAFLLSTETGLRAYARIDLSEAHWKALQFGQKPSISAEEGLKTLFFEGSFVGLGDVLPTGHLKVKRLLEIPPQKRAN